MSEVKAVIRAIVDDIQFNPGIYYAGVVLQTVLLSSLVIVSNNNNWLITNCATIDALFSSIDVIVQIIAKTKVAWYNQTMVHRYIYYILIGLLDIIIWFVFWGYFYWGWHFAMCVILSPRLLNWILSCYNVKQVIEIIYMKIMLVYHFCICSCVVYVVKYVFENSLNRKITLDWKDVHKGIQKVRLDRYKRFLKTFLVATVLHYFENANGGLQLLLPYIIDMMYRYGAVVSIENDGQIIDFYSDYPTERKKLCAFMETKKWEHLENPYVLRSIIVVYKQSPPGDVVHKIRKLLGLISKCFVKFSAIYALISAFPVRGLSVGCSLLLLQFDSYDLVDICIKIVGGVVGYYYGSEIISATICEFLPILLNNKIMKFILAKNLQWVIQNSYILHHINKYNYCIITNIIAFITLPNTLGYKIVCIVPMSANLLIGLWFLLLGWFSGYNTLHVIVLGAILYISINIAQMKQAKKPRLKIDIVDNYTPVNNEKDYNGDSDNDDEKNNGDENTKTDNLNIKNEHYEEFTLI